jgi:hypothetical protein
MHYTGFEPPIATTTSAQINFARSIDYWFQKLKEFVSGN